MPVKPQYVYEFGPFRLDPAERLLIRENEPVPLTPKVFDILVLLVRHRDHLMTKEKLMEALWPGTYVEQSNLNQNIFLLRKALGAANGNPMIETVPKIGYRFVEPVSERPKDEHRNAEKPALRAWPLSRRLLAVIAVLALGLLIISFYRYLPIRNIRQVRSIAVLPLRTFGTADSENYLGYGLADALITRLSYLHGVTVRPSSAIRKYVNKNADAVVAGRELEVDAVLDGSIQRSGNRLRLTVQLVSVETGESLWATQVDHNPSDLFALEDSVSEAVVATLALHLTADEKGRLDQWHGEVPEAYQAYLHGRTYLSQRNPEELRRALGSFSEAVAKNPSYALAHTGLAETYILMAHNVLPPASAYAKAEEEAKDAIRLDEHLAEPHVALGWVRQFYDWNWGDAEREYTRALTLNPNLPVAHHWYSNLLMATGRTEQALREIERARQLDPSSLIINTVIAVHLLYARRTDEAIAQLQRTLAIDPAFAPGHFALGLAYEQKSMLRAALIEMSRGYERANRGPYGLMYVGYAYALAGNREKALQAARQLEAEAALLQPLGIAKIYGALGERDRAIVWIERAFDARATDLVWLRQDPMFDRIRDDPRFEAYCAKVGLPR